MYQEKHVHTEEVKVTCFYALSKTTFIVNLIKLRRRQSMQIRLIFTQRHTQRHTQAQLETLTKPYRWSPPLPYLLQCESTRDKCVSRNPPSDFIQMLYSTLTIGCFCTIIRALECRKAKLNSNSPCH